MIPDAQCNYCKNVDWERSQRNLFYYCKAYPSGVPIEIAINGVDHTKPYKGDNGIQFERK